MNKQLIKDLGLLLNDGRIGFVDVRSDKQRHVEIGDGNGILIGRIVFAYPNGDYCILAQHLHVTYDNLLDTVRAIYAKHPTRVMDDVLYSVKYDIKRGSYSFAVTNGSNLELFGVRHHRISAALVDELEYFIHKCDVKYVTQYCDSYISHFDRSGGYTFHI